MSAPVTARRPRGPASVRAEAARLARPALAAVAALACDSQTPPAFRIQAARLLVKTAMQEPPRAD